MSLKRIQERAAQYKRLKRPHVSEFSEQITASREAIDELVGLFVTAAENSGSFNENMMMPEFMDELIKVAKDFAGRALSLLSRTELSRKESDKIIVSLANYISAPVDMGMNTNDLS